MPWSTTTATTKSWGSGQTTFTTTYSASTPGIRPSRWAQDKLSTYTQYDIGANFVIIADEQQWNFTDNDRPIAVPPDSGYSIP